MPREKVAERHRSPAVWIAVFCGAGDFPYAPGTVGSLVGVGLVAAFDATPFAHAWRAALLAVTTGLLFAIGVWAAGGGERYFGRKDPGNVVIDEVVGQMVGFLLYPHVSWKLLLAGFVLFRLFDVIKPFPARRAEQLQGGWGIMVDDLVAGAYALVAVTVLEHAIR